MMNFCPNCGCRMNQGVWVCPNCGAAFKADNEQAVQSGYGAQNHAAMRYGNAAQMNSGTPGAGNGASFDDWGSGTIFVNPEADQAASYSSQVQSRSADVYAQSSPAQNYMYGGANPAQSAVQDDWNDGTVFAGQEMNAQYQARAERQSVSMNAVPQPMPMRTPENPYQEKRIQTPYTPPVQKPEKKTKARAPKKEKVKMDGGTLRDTIIKIVAVVVVLVCIVVGAITGGF